ncbi:hypothetical protein EC973_008899 [Apophysomyces ossiformis]|uniref:Uncharacterized protein n=1 Tax=Apophysomyces ossiformis TaxID=679940 RepID=A0A8H7ETU6_9FUNG|nr:hypothetical protein EC973_008899 [Apophysomyces ossiformis]
MDSRSDEDDDPMVEDDYLDDSVYFDDMPNRRGSRSERAADAAFREVARSSHQGLVESMDEKGEQVFGLMQQEKIVHQKFFNEFDDDFDDEDMA